MYRTKYFSYFGIVLDKGTKSIGNANSKQLPNSICVVSSLSYGVNVRSFFISYFICSTNTQTLNQTPSMDSLYTNQNNCRQRSVRDTTLYNMYTTQQPDVATNQSTGVNTYDSYDWSSAGQTATSALTHGTLHKLYDQTVSVKTGSVMQLQSDIKHNSNPYFGSYSNDQLNFKRQNGSHAYGKKTTNEISDMNVRSNIPDMYYHHVSNLI